MANSEMLIKEYYSRHRDKMIDCPFQPGNLKISQKACRLRRKAASRKKGEPLKSEDSFNYFVSQGLLRCEKCTL
jgi:hypothetical protein